MPKPASGTELTWLLDELAGTVPSVHDAVLLSTDGLAVAASSGLSVAQQPVSTVRTRPLPRPAAFLEPRAAVPVTVQELTTWRSASASEPTTRCPAASNWRPRRSISAWLSLQPRLVGVAGAVLC